ncbi:MAG: hypothetical protein Q9200_003265 [Gallowayella weberi]
MACNSLFSSSVSLLQPLCVFPASPCLALKSDDHPAPCFLRVAIYYILGALIIQHGQHFSPLSPRKCLVIFMTIDFIAISVQAIGGGLVASELATFPSSDTTTGVHVMAAGTSTQLVSMTLFAFFWAHFVWRARSKLRRERALVLATSLSVLLILVRNMYLVLQAGQGWQGELMTHELYLTVLDGILMVLAVGLFNVVFPGRYLLSERDMRRVQSTARRGEAVLLGPSKAVRGWGIAGRSV